MGFADDANASLQVILQDPLSTIVLVLSLTVIIGIFCFLSYRFFEKWTIDKPWWPDAKPRQKQLLMNFTYPEETLTDAVILEGWAYVLVICIHHFVAGSLLVPPVIFGWEGAGPWGQLCFKIGCLLELAFDVWDAVRMFCLLTMPKIFTCMAPVPCFVFIIGVVCHHQLAIILVYPLLAYYPERQEFHRVACALLLAAGFSYATGAYKFTLNTTTRAGFVKYKIVVIMQLSIILYTRVWVWATETISLLNFFAAEKATTFWWGGLTGICLMSVFNLAVVSDGTSAAIKWLPKKMPTEEQEIQALEHSKSDLILPFLAKSFSDLTGTGNRRSVNQPLEVQL